MFSSFSASPLDGGASLASTEFNKSEVMVGCGCKSPRDIISFSKERKIEFLDLAWADEMGLWHHEIVSIQDVSEATILKGISTASGLVLLPDPLSARIALFTQPNTIHMVCSTDASNEGTQGPRSSLKLKQLNPGWVMMISNQVMQSKTPKRGELDLLIHACEVPTSPPRGGGGNSGGGIEWKIVRNGGDSPPYGSPRSPGSPSATVPSSPPGLSVSPPMVFESEETRKRLTTEGIPGVPSGYVPPPLLRPRQVHPTKASRLGLQEKPAKKRKNTENLFCRHCGTKDTPEWRRGPDGRKSLCNACGLHYSKTIKRETLVTPQVQQPRTGNLHFILNPS